jgi:hypothetical protein
VALLSFVRGDILDRDGPRSRDRGGAAVRAFAGDQRGAATSKQVVEEMDALQQEQRHRRCSACNRFASGAERLIATARNIARSIEVDP